MKILLSAYACEPGKGSEPGVGWHWAVELANLGHEIWVITRENNRILIEREAVPAGIHFEYYDLPDWLRRWKKGSQGVHLYYFLWQIGAYFKARRLSRSIRFDWVQHVTFVGVRQPSFMGLLGIPFIFGPVAGGESAPLILRKRYPWRGKLLDRLRDIANAALIWNPLMWLTFLSARIIAVTSLQTQELIPGFCQKKCRVQLAIGAPPVQENLSRNRSALNALKVLYIGNLLYLKGIHLALEAFARHRDAHPHSRFTLIGGGPEERWLKQLSDQYALTGSVHWIPRMDQNELLAQYGQYDVLLFPSLHDSGGMVVLEAMANGLPVISLDLGGPGEMVNASCGFRIETAQKNEALVIREIAAALDQLTEDRALYDRLSEGALQRTRELSWQNQIQTFYRSLSIEKG